jgi:cation:H+ antiporter
MSAVGWFIMGIAALIGGAELVVHGGSRLAARLGVPPIVIGLTIVSIGTSTPELAVGIEAGLEGSGSLAVGNIAGAITFNLLFILGLSALLKPLAVSVRTIRFGLPTMIVVAVALMAMAWNGVLARVEGAVLVGAALIYTVMIVRLTRRESRAVRAEFAREYGTPRDGRAPRDIVWNLGALAVGITVTVVGSEWLVDGAVQLARMLGVSDAFIGLTVVTFGTSSPELVTPAASDFGVDGVDAGVLFRSRPRRPDLHPVRPRPEFNAYLQHLHALPGETMGPVSAARLPPFRHLPISWQPLVVTRVAQLEAGRGVTPRLPAHDRRVPWPARGWHRTCSASLATAKRSTAPAARRRLAGQPAAAPDRRGVGRDQG